jgi:predicted kinase
MSTLYMMVGIPGSGKSTFAKTLKGKYVSRDEVRFKLLQD